MKSVVFFCAQVRSTEVANGCREDVDTALLKLYAEQDQDCLLDLLSSNNACLLADSVPWLEKYHKCVCVIFFSVCRTRILRFKSERKANHSLTCHVVFNSLFS